ncbi:DUF2274 domain-containing protein [Ferrovibrio sp.]|jgi:hypothetical protein|uniref:DUF2274 domain-containing protein n=1 Tax=Ferrovibrio sp. TaxID=1917215 RepID=UPI001BC20D29|nr:DUF2274 domain-containing protein [Ferrovibrio sp.]MBS4047025.1 DUF2274 domain-containing protein [Alphaproteobacteria bacterium]
MSGLKLPKLPDRTPVKISISLHPDLNRRLQVYADFYKETYGEAESLTELIPYMLEEFLKADKAFSARARK